MVSGKNGRFGNVRPVVVRRPLLLGVLVMMVAVVVVLLLLLVVVLDVDAVAIVV